MHIKEALKLYAKATRGPITVEGYRDWRLTQPADTGLPCYQAIYRWAGNWPSAAAACGLEDRLWRIKGAFQIEDLLQSLRDADVVWRKVNPLEEGGATSHWYDRTYRTEHNPDAPSSSAIRKWLGGFALAQERAGVRPTAHCTPAQLRAQQAMHSSAQAFVLLRGLQAQTWRDVDDRVYEQFRSKLLPSAEQLMDAYGEWRDVLTEADVRLGDEIHPQEIWTVTEARRLFDAAKAKLGAPPTASDWADLRERSVKDLPSWQAVCELCPERIAG